MSETLDAIQASIYNDVHVSLKIGDSIADKVKNTFFDFKKKPDLKYAGMPSQDVFSVIAGSENYFFPKGQLKFSLGKQTFTVEHVDPLRLDVQYFREVLEVSYDG